MQPVVLRSERLVLSAPTMDDVDAITAACQDADVQAWTTVPSPYTRSDAEQFITRVVGPAWDKGTECTWAMRTADGEFAGMIGLSRIASGQAELGFWLARERRASHLMSEAGRTACEFGFSSDGLGLQRIEWHAFLGNTASTGVARALGFRFEGVQRLGGLQRGRRLDQWSAALLSDDERSAVVNGWPRDTFGQVAAGPLTSSPASAAVGRADATRLGS